MQSPLVKFRQSSIISVKPCYLSEKLKNRQAPTAIEFNDFFCWNFPTYEMSTKGCSAVFFNFVKILFYDLGK